MKVGHGFDVDAHPVGTRVGEGIDEVVGVLDHQVHVDGKPGRGPETFHEGRAHGEVRHEVPIHDVGMDETRASGFGPGHFFGEPREVGREDRRSEDHDVLLTSTATMVLGVTRKPAAGVCLRMIPPAPPGSFGR